MMYSVVTWGIQDVFQWAKAINDLQNDKVRWSAREKVLNKQLREFKESLNEALTRAAMEQAKRLKLEQQLVD